MTRGSESSRSLRPVLDLPSRSVPLWSQSPKVAVAPRSPSRPGGTPSRRHPPESVPDKLGKWVRKSWTIHSLGRVVQARGASGHDTRLRQTTCHFLLHQVGSSDTCLGGPSTVQPPPINVLDLIYVLGIDLFLFLLNIFILEFTSFPPSLHFSETFPLLRLWSTYK